MLDKILSRRIYVYFLPYFSFCFALAPFLKTQVLAIC